MKRCFVSALAVVTALSGCGNDPEASQVLLVAKSALSGAQRSAPAQPQITRALLDQIVTPVMLARLEKRGAVAPIAEIQRNGPVETWSTLDDITISLRDGVIVATRGLGGDLMAAHVPAASQLSSAGSSYTRTYSHLNGEDQMVRREFSCETSAIGQKTIEIIEINYSVRHFVEDCVGASKTFRNDFWLGSAGKFRKSRQWVGEDLGYVILEDPKR